MSIREQMYRAQEHIQNKEYAEAREILITIDHPRAREWLEKLDTMASSLALPQNNAQQKRRYIPENWRPGYLPINPNHIGYAAAALAAPISYGLRRFLRDKNIVDDVIANVAAYSIALACLALVVCGIPYAVNWGRLARPRWGHYTILVVLITLVSIPTAAILYPHFIEVNQPIPALLTLAVLAIAIGVGIALPSATMKLQYAAFKKWDTDNVKPVLYHEYSWDIPLMGAFGFVVLCVIGAFIIYAVKPPFSTLQSDDFTIHYSWHWREAPCYFRELPACVSELKRVHRNDVYDIRVYKYPRGSWVTPSDAQTASLDALRAENPETGVVGIQDLVIDGAPARYLDTITLHRYGCSDFNRHIYILHGAALYQIEASVCEDKWATFEPMMMNVVQGFDLH